MDLHLGDILTAKIHFGLEGGLMIPPQKGTVVYIHPQGRFFTLEFTFPKGSFRESYPLRNAIRAPMFGAELTFDNRKDAMDKLKKEFRWTSVGSSELSWDGDPKGIRFRKPVEWLLGWGAMYDALAANALDAAIEQATTEPPKAPLVKLKENAGGASPAPTREPMPDPMTAPTVTTSQQWWRSCRDDPPKGWMLAVVLTPMDRSRKYFDVDLMQWHDGKWWGVYDASEDEMDADGSWWAPAAAVPAEVWK